MSEAILSCVIALSSCRLAVAMNESLTQLKDTTANPAPLGLLGFGMTTVLLNLHNAGFRSEEHTSELQSRFELVCRLLLEKKKSTLAYAVLFLLLSAALGAVAANAVALSATAIGNTAANRRLTFGLRGREGLVRHHARGAAVYFFNVTATTEIYTLSLHDALPI